MQKVHIVLVYIKLFSTAVFWGGTFIAGRIISKEVGPFSAAFLRFAIASIFLLLIARKAEGGLPAVKKTQIIPLIILGMTGVFAYNVFFFKGLKLIEAGRASLIIANNPIFIMLSAAWFFKERLSLIKLAGVIISVTGAVIVITKGNLLEIVNGSAGWGEFYIFCCVISWAAYSIIGKAVMAELTPLVSVSYSSVAGAAGLFIPACFEGMMGDLVHYTPLSWLSILYLGVFGTVIGFVWYYQGIKEIGPMKASQFINFVPISAILSAFFLLGEPITLSLLIGGVFVISGVYLTNMPAPASKESL